MNVIEGNKLIAEFMGYTYYPEKYLNGIKGRLDKKGKLSLHFDDTKPCHVDYHESWDSLMPVVAKINKTGVFRVDIHFAGNGTNPIYTCYVDKIEWSDNYPNITEIYSMSDIKNPIKVVWFTIVEFIKWHNSQPK